MLSGWMNGSAFVEKRNRLVLVVKMTLNDDEPHSKLDYRFDLRPWTHVEVQSHTTAG